MGNALNLKYGVKLSHDGKNVTWSLISNPNRFQHIEVSFILCVPLCVSLSISMTWSTIQFAFTHTLPASESLIHTVQCYTKCVVACVVLVLLLLFFFVRHTATLYDYGQKIWLSVKWLKLAINFQMILPGRFDTKQLLDIIQRHTVYVVDLSFPSTTFQHGHFALRCLYFGTEDPWYGVCAHKSTDITPITNLHTTTI